MKHRIALVAAAAALAVGLGVAQTAPGARAHRGFDRLAQHLNLTDAQKQTAQAAFDQARQAAQPVMEQLKQNRQALEDAVKANKPEAELNRLAAQTGVLVGQLTAIHTSAMSKVYATLTPEQKQKADELHSLVRGGFEDRFHGGFAGPRMHQ